MDNKYAYLFCTLFLIFCHYDKLFDLQLKVGSVVLEKYSKLFIPRSSNTDAVLEMRPNYQPSFCRMTDPTFNVSMSATVLTPS